MANKIILKKSSVISKVPLSTDLDYGELAINYADGKLYFKKADGTTIDSFSSGQASSDISVVLINSSTYSATQTSGNHVLLCDTSANNVTISLPTAFNNKAIFNIKKTAPANLMIIDANSSETIDGDTVININAQYEAVTLVSDNSNWSVI